MAPVSIPAVKSVMSGTPLMTICLTSGCIAVFQ